jgi:hypothetical protein
MGYEVYGFATNGKVVKAWRRRVAPTTSWTRVGKNAEMMAWEKERIANCPYPLDIALERFHIGDEERYGVLLHYGQEQVTVDLKGWFTFGNVRQTIEAGVEVSGYHDAFFKSKVMPPGASLSETPGHDNPRGGQERLPDAPPEGTLARRIGDPGRVRRLRCQLRPLGSRMATPGLSFCSSTV